MREMTGADVRAVQTAGGAWTKVRAATFEELGVVLLGQRQPVFSFVDDETGVTVTVPRSQVVAVDGDLVEPPPPPPPPPPDPLVWSASAGRSVRLRDPATLPPEAHGRILAHLDELYTERRSGTRLGRSSDAHPFGLPLVVGIEGNGWKVPPMHDGEQFNAFCGRIIQRDPGQPRAPKSNYDVKSDALRAFSDSHAVERLRDLFKERVPGTVTPVPTRLGGDHRTRALAEGETLPQWNQVADEDPVEAKR